jgi:hypothetical protein
MVGRQECQQEAIRHNGEDEADVVYTAREKEHDLTHGAASILLDPRNIEDAMASRLSLHAGYAYASTHLRPPPAAVRSSCPCTFDGGDCRIQQPRAGSNQQDAHPLQPWKCIADDVDDDGNSCILLMHTSSAVPHPTLIFHLPSMSVTHLSLVALVASASRLGLEWMQKRCRLENEEYRSPS